MEPDVEDPWICEASPLEKLYDQTHKNGTFLMVYQLSLSTVLPLQEDHVRLSLEHLRRKCPNLQMCFGERNGNTWFRKSKNDDIDFQLVTDMSAEEVRDQLQIYQYNSSEGPLWCARLLVDAERDSLAIDDGFPYTSHLIFGVHHSTVDGTTVLKIFGSFVKILENVIAGKSVSEGKIGHFVSDTKNEELVSGKMDVIQNNPSMMQELSDIITDKGIGKPLLLSVIPPPEGGEDKTYNQTKVLDKNTTKSLLDKCKTEGVTIHSAFTACANVSVVKLLPKTQVTSNSYRLSNGHIINLRRYWSGDTSQVLGCHAHFPLWLWTDVPKDIERINFWDFVRTLHHDIHHHVKEETVLFMEAFLKLNFPDPTYDDIFHPTNQQQFDGGFSNLGNITSLVTEGGYNVRPYLLKRHISLHHTSIYNFAYFFHSFRGRLILNLLYNTKFYKPDLAKKQCDQIFDILKEVIKQ